MKAIILAAGKATRLLPLTKDTPQCLLKIQDKTTLQHQIDALNKAKINDINVMCGYLADKVEKFCKEKGIQTILNPFYEVSGMALTLWIAREQLKKGFLFLYSDILFRPEIIDGLIKSKGDVCLAIKKDGLRDEAEKIIENNGIISSVSKNKVKGENGEFIGIAKFSSIGAKKLIEELDQSARKNLNTSFIDVIDKLIEDGEKVYAYDIKDAPFVDIDFPEDIKKAEKIIPRL